MNNQRTRYVATTDGATIGATVHGQGPPLVFSPGGIGDADLDWQAVMPHMVDRFTCHLPSLRGRGLSDDHPDLRLSRLVDDLAAYIDSVGEAAGLVGWSAGGMALAVAARSDAIDAVAAIESTMFHLMNDEEPAGLGVALARLRELAAEGDLQQAVRTFLSVPFNDEEVALADEAGYFEAAGRYVPTLLDQLTQTMESEEPGPNDPAVRAAISAPVLVVHGSNTKAFLNAGARYVAEHAHPQREAARDTRSRTRRPADPPQGARRGAHGVLLPSRIAGLIRSGKRGLEHAATKRAKATPRLHGCSHPKRATTNSAVNEPRTPAISTRSRPVQCVDYVRRRLDGKAP